MYKYQKFPLKSKKTVPEIVEKAAAKKLESKKLATSKTDSPISITSIASPVSKDLETTKTTETPKAVSPSQAGSPLPKNPTPPVLEISKANFKFKLISNNNNRTPIPPRAVILSPEEKEELINRKLTAPQASLKFTIKENQLTENLQAVADILNQVSIDKSTQTPSKKVKQEPTPPKVDYRKTCTCELINKIEETKVAPVPIQIPKKPEPKGPIYRWVGVKDDSLKTEQERKAEIQRLLPKVQEVPKETKASTYRRKPKVCFYCRNNKERQLEYERQRAKASAKKKTPPRKPPGMAPALAAMSDGFNRFGYLLDDESA